MASCTNLMNRELIRSGVALWWNQGIGVWQGSGQGRGHRRVLDPEDWYSHRGACSEALRGDFGPFWIGSWLRMLFPEVLCDILLLCRPKIDRRIKLLLTHHVLTCWPRVMSYDIVPDNHNPPVRFGIAKTPLYCFDLTRFSSTSASYASSLSIKHCDRSGINTSSFA